MENLIIELEIIENEHKDFFEKNNLKLSSYVSISRKPVMIRFNHHMDNKYKLPYAAYEKVHALILSYYDVVRL